MKMRIMLCLVLVALFGFSGKAFAVDPANCISRCNSNTVIGQEAGQDITTGVTNTFVGYQAGANNNSGSDNTFVGREAGSSNTSGYDNTFVGKEAGKRNTGYYNTFIGRSAGKNNTSGGSNISIGNMAGGSFGINTDNTGNQNIFIGESAGSKNTSGEVNTFIGTRAGKRNETGSDNIFIGHFAGSENVNGSRNVFLGYLAGSLETGSDKLFIDNSGTPNPLIWGDFNTNNVVIHGGFRAIASYISSDQRWKKSIQPLESSLDKISNLQGVSYEWKTDEYPDFGLTEGKQIGLVAQDVESVLPELVSEEKDGYKAVSYTKLTAVLVEAVKELKVQNEKQQAEIEELRAMIKELKS
jgi:hypothetical protein